VSASLAIRGAPDYESGGQEFESLRARHLIFITNIYYRGFAMQNGKTCMASAWPTLGQLRGVGGVELRRNVPHGTTDALERLGGVPITAWSEV
jgi:hypothetical protein